MLNNFKYIFSMLCIYREVYKLQIIRVINILKDQIL